MTDRKNLTDALQKLSEDPEGEPETPPAAPTPMPSRPPSTPPAAAAPTRRAPRSEPQPAAPRYNEHPAAAQAPPAAAAPRDRRRPRGPGHRDRRDRRVPGQPRGRPPMTERDRPDTPAAQEPAAPARRFKLRLPQARRAAQTVAQPAANAPARGLRRPWLCSPWSCSSSSRPERPRTGRNSPSTSSSPPRRRSRHRCPPTCRRPPRSSNRTPPPSLPAASMRTSPSRQSTRSSPNPDPTRPPPDSPEPPEADLRQAAATPPPWEALRRRLPPRPGRRGALHVAAASLRLAAALGPEPGHLPHQRGRAAHPHAPEPRWTALPLGRGCTLRPPDQRRPRHRLDRSRHRLADGVPRAPPRRRPRALRHARRRRDRRGQYRAGRPGPHARLRPRETPCPSSCRHRPRPALLLRRLCAHDCPFARPVQLGSTIPISTGRSRRCPRLRTRLPGRHLQNDPEAVARPSEVAHPHVETPQHPRKRACRGSLERHRGQLRESHEPVAPRPTRCPPGRPRPPRPRPRPS